MATSTDLIVNVKADTSGFTRDMKKARRHIFWHGVFLPMLAGASTALLGFILGFIVGVSA